MKQWPRCLGCLVLLGALAAAAAAAPREQGNLTAGADRLRASATKHLATGARRAAATRQQALAPARLTVLLTSNGSSDLTKPAEAGEALENATRESRRTAHSVPAGWVASSWLRTAAVVLGKMWRPPIEPPSGADIWNASVPWETVRHVHPAGVISNVFDGQVRWNEASFLSLDGILALSGICYPAALTGLFVVASVMVSLCLTLKDPGYQDFHREDGPEYLEYPAVLPKEELTDFSRRIYRVWCNFCSTIPCLYVFGLPMLLILLSRHWPQETFSVLSLLTAMLIFSNGVYLVVYAGSSILRMNRLMAIDSSSSSAWKAGVLGSAQLCQAPADLDGKEVLHWVILPQYKEDAEVVAMTLGSVSKSCNARSSVSILLAMEQREQGAAEKAEKLRQQFAPYFAEIMVTFHPPDLPNDPPGKASNTAWAFRKLLTRLTRRGADLTKVVLTVSDADSEFHPRYFEVLSHAFLETNEEVRHLRLWQAPCFHLKNYHRQPMPVVVGTMFTCIQELASLSDPNAVRFPYSTYSLSLELARRVGGWDAEWIAEDWHMGIKCFLCTIGQTTVEPILLPTLNYTPEDTTWWGTVAARWSQAKRHALGFSDLSYYFMMLPLVFGHSVAISNRAGSMKALRRFWGMMAYGMTLLVRIINVHVVIGLLTCYSAFVLLLRLAMYFLLGESRHVEFLLERAHDVTMVLGMPTLGLCLVNTMLFMSIYGLMKPRIEDKPFLPPFLHWLYGVACYAVCGPFFFLGLGIAVWKAAIQMLFTSTFEYEVALKPTSASRLDSTLVSAS